MPSVVQICNKALDKLGQNPIISLTDGNKAASICNRNWEMIRDEVLRAHPWNFAVTRATLAPSSIAPDWGFANKFPLPSDNLRLLEVLDLSTNEYQVEKRFILADDDVLYIRYIARITDPNEYDAQFVNLAASRLAIELCEPLTQSTTKKKMLWDEYSEFITSATRADGQENPPQQFEEDEWISVRY